MWCKKIFILCRAKCGGIAFLIVAHIFFPVELTPLWIWYEVAGSLRVLGQNRAQGVSLESSGRTFTYPGPPPPTLSNWKKDRQTMVKIEGRGQGVGLCSQTHWTQPGLASPYRELTSGPCWVPVLPPAQKGQCFGSCIFWKGLLLNSRNTNQIKWLLCLRTIAGSPIFLG